MDRKSTGNRYTKDFKIVVSRSFENSDKTDPQ